MSKRAANPGGLLRVAGAFTLLAVLGIAMLAPARAQQATPERVKAVFLYNFGSFVEWPQASHAADAFTIAVYGAPSIHEELRRIAAGRTMLGRPVQVRSIDSIPEIGDASILFVGEDQVGRLARIAEVIQGRPVLIVAESEGALSRGATINFTVVDQRVRFEVSL
jgi:hypothetical protein